MREQKSQSEGVYRRYKVLFLVWEKIGPLLPLARIPCQAFFCQTTLGVMSVEGSSNLNLSYPGSLFCCSLLEARRIYSPQFARKFSVSRSCTLAGVEKLSCSVEQGLLACT